MNIITLKNIYKLKQKLLINIKYYVLRLNNYNIIKTQNVDLKIC